MHITALKVFTAVFSFCFINLMIQVNSSDSKRRVCPLKWLPFGDSCLWLSDTRLSHNHAHTFCHDAGGELLKIPDKATQEILEETMNYVSDTKAKRFWISVIAGRNNEQYWTEISQVNSSYTNVANSEKVISSQDDCLGAASTNSIKENVFQCNATGFYSCVHNRGNTSCGKTLSKYKVCMSPLTKATHWWEALVECSQQGSILIDNDSLLKADPIDLIPGMMKFEHLYLISYNISLTYNESKTLCMNLFETANQLSRDPFSLTSYIFKILKYPVWYDREQAGLCKQLTVSGEIENKNCTEKSAPLCYFDIKKTSNALWKGRHYTNENLLINVDFELTYDLAQAVCEQLSPGSKLLEIYTQEEWKKTRNLMNTKYWIGGRDFLNNRTFVWAHKRDLEIHHNVWLVDDLIANNGHCVALNSEKMLLENRNCNDNFFVLCELSSCTDETWNKLNNTCFKIFDKQSWDKGNSTCQAVGANLMEMYSKKTQEQVSTIIKSFNPKEPNTDPTLFWIGGHYDTNSERFIMVRSGKPIRENWWITSSFDDLNQIEECVEKYDTNLLNDVPCNFTLKFVCQLTPLRHFTTDFVGHNNVYYAMKANKSAYGNWNSKQTHLDYSCGAVDKANNFHWEGQPCEYLEHFICRKEKTQYETDICLGVEEHGLTFNHTPAGSYLNVSCPLNYNGNILRHCSTQGLWHNINFENCTRNGLEILQKTVNDLKTINDTLNIQAAVEHLAAHLATTLDDYPSLKPNEIDNIVGTMKVAAEKITLHESIIDVETLQNFTYIANNMIVSKYNIINKNISQNTGFSLIITMDMLATGALKTINETTGDIKIQQSNMDILISSTIEDITISEYTLKRSSKTDSYIAPAFELHLSGKNFNETTPFAVVMYTNYSDFVSLDVKETDRYSATTKKLGSVIVSFSIKDIHFLQEPLYLNFSIPTDLSSDVTCVFLDKDQSSNFVWSTKGCQLVGVTDHMASCSCDHLTSFAVLVNMGNSPIFDSNALSIISKVGCSISISFLVATLAIYAIVWSYIKSRRSVLYVNLSACLMTTYIVFITGIQATGNTIICILIAVLLHYLLLVAFMNMLAIGISILHSATSVYENWLMRTLFPMIYGIPFVIVGICLAVTEIKGYGSKSLCWLVIDDGVRWAFIGPVIAVTLVNIGVIISVIRIMHSNRAMMVKTKRDKIISSIRAVGILSPVLGMTWIFGILAASTEYFVFIYLFVIGNTLQGLLIFVFQCCLQEKVREGLKAFHRRLSINSFWSSFGASNPASNNEPIQKRTPSNTLDGS